MPPNTQDPFAYNDEFSNLYLPTEQLEQFNLTQTDDILIKSLVDELNKDVDYWNQEPWRLQLGDLENVKYLLGDLEDKLLVQRGSEKMGMDNRLFTAVRAILSYATGQLAMPEITPSRSDDEYIKMARSIQQALYQHSADEQVDQKFRAAVLNLVTRKRAFIKQRYDPNKGIYGDIVTEVCNPEDVIISRHAKFMDNPSVIYHRLRCSVDELIARFPAKAMQVRTLYSIKQGRWSQMSRFVTYFEAWYTYLDKGVPKEAVCWFINDPGQLILDKMPNPNWIYTGDDKEDKQTNVLFTPPKPFTPFNYLNLGHAYIDETSLFEQAKPLQEDLNKRLYQFNRNVELMNGRWVYGKKALSDEDAARFVNKGSKTLLGVNAEDVNKAINVLTPNALPNQVYESIIDSRQEIDTIMGTPSVFRGGQPEGQDTLGRDLLVKQQAGMLQDDLVRSVQKAYQNYYSIKLQLMRTYYTDDYWFQVKGGDGKFDFIMLNGDNIDSNVKIGVEVDSTLPLDKEAIRATSMNLAKMNRIDMLTLMEDLGLPDPEIRTERFMRSQLFPMDYASSVDKQIDSNDAEVDIMLLTAGKEPTERDNYDADYLNYFNNFITENKFRQLAPQVQQQITTFLQEVTQRAQRTALLQTQMQGSGGPLDDAGMDSDPQLPPIRPTVSVRAVTSPGEADSIAQQATGAQSQQAQQQVSQGQQSIQSGPPAAPTQ